MWGTEKSELRRLLAAVTLSSGLLVSFSGWGAPEQAVSVAVTEEGQGRKALLAALPEGVSLRYLNELAPLYSARQMQPMWQDHEAAKLFQQQLAELALSGVQPQFIQWVKALTDPAISGLAHDVLLSDAMLGYLQFVSGVAVNGNKWLYSSTPYRLAAPSAEVIHTWQQALDDGRLAAHLAELAPQHPQYAKMQQALKILVADVQPWPEMVVQKTLRPGELSDDVPALREILTRTGMMSAAAAPEVELIPLDAQGEGKPQAVPESDMVDTALTDTAVSPAVVPVEETAQQASAKEHGQRYDDALVAAVKRFQLWQGLEDDGVIGKRTRDWLNVSSEQRAALLALNIQRLRIVPGEVETGIMVNIPNYSLIYYQNGKEVLSSRVIVGRPSRKTPLMSNSLNNVVVNPPWSVPTLLTREDIVPKAKQDPDYLERNGYTIFSDWSNEAEVIDPYSIDWSTVSSRHFPYRLRQAPGATNSLGRFKFNMPNSEAIYLHDTPNRNLFNKDIRALSSGCIRVNKAAELADMLLQDAGWNDTRISATLKKGNTTYVPIRERIPVNLYYLTAWVGDDGKPQFRTDIYNYDGTVRSGAQILTQASQLL